MNHKKTIFFFSMCLTLGNVASVSASPLLLGAVVAWIVTPHAVGKYNAYTQDRERVQTDAIKKIEGIQLQDPCSESKIDIAKAQQGKTRGWQMSYILTSNDKKYVAPISFFPFVKIKSYEKTSDEYRQSLQNQRDTLIKAEYSQRQVLAHTLGMFNQSKK